MFRFLKRKETPRLRQRWAGVYRYGERVMVHAGGMSVEGLAIAAEPACSCRADEAGALGQLVREALSHSRDGIVFPDETRGYFRPILKAAGVTSWRALETGAVYVSVHEADGALRLLPHRTGGTRGERAGFHALPDGEEDVAAGSSDEFLGEAVLEALDRCIPYRE